VKNAPLKINNSTILKKRSLREKRSRKHFKIAYLLLLIKNLQSAVRSLSLRKAIRKMSAKKLMSAKARASSHRKMTVIKHRLSLPNLS